MPSEKVEKIYNNFVINRRQAQTLAFFVLSHNIDEYIEEHREEYERFLQEENKHLHETAILFYPFYPFYFFYFFTLLNIRPFHARQCGCLYAGSQHRLSVE